MTNAIDRLSRRDILFAVPASALLVACDGIDRPVPPPPRPRNPLFPLRRSANGRFLETATGEPFLLVGDSPWSMPTQLKRPQIDAYFEDRKPRGFNAIMFIAPEHGASSQTPVWINAEGQAPFTKMEPPNWRLNDAYWKVVDHIVDRASDHGMACVFFPAWFGYAGNATGWASEIFATKPRVLRAYGEALGERYSQGNVIWALGGDAAINHKYRDLQWNIALGIRSRLPDALITAHPRRTQDTFDVWSGYPGFNLNTIYTDHKLANEYGEAADAYAKPGPMPFFNIEGLYENDPGFSYGGLRREAYVSVLAGAAGYFFGNNPLWGFGEPSVCGGKGPEHAMATALDTPGAQEMTKFVRFFSSWEWYKLQPRTDASLVTSALGEGDKRVVPAIASDRTFAMVWTRGVPFTVDYSALGVPQVRARWFDPAMEAYEPVGDGKPATGGRHDFQPPGDRILVLDGG